ncbi:MAG TPA: precorrin-6A synthase (deacetylating) [Paracoccus sp. (in: a-proteobacteria)]|nr:precorrin-6A synthase (deacetylating) [Paracoccus sp. (in: a-proteobacteria)]
MELLLIGIGTGDPGHLTRAAESALRSADLVLIPDKGEDKADLAALRDAICDKVAPHVPRGRFPVPPRRDDAGYLAGVTDWHDALAAAWTAAIPPDARRVALLVWGDPSLYDSTLRIAARLKPAPKVTVIPGITALQALTAAHAIPVVITTGRQLRDHGWPPGADRVAVMLDGGCAFETLEPAGVTIWWGAYVGMDRQMLDHGPLAEAGPRIVAARRAARERHGWVMDIYLLDRAAG